jgi:prephenate dehydrogenase
MANLQQALALGVIDEIAQDLKSAVRGADMVLVAVPVKQTAGVLGQLSQCLEEGVVVTDAGSTKRDFVRMAREIFASAVQRVVPGHPIAGAESTGVDAATAELFVGKRTVLTPLADTDADAVACVESMWRACGARVVRMSPDHHDAVFSAVSHLPHVLSYALVGMIASRSNCEELFSFAASGFRDFTRIAGSSPEMWRDICAANGDQLLRDIDAFQQALSLLSGYIRDGRMDQVEAVFAAAAKARNAWAGDLK